MAPPKLMNFRESAKGVRVIFNPKIYIADIRPLHLYKVLVKIHDDIKFDKNKSIGTKVSGLG